MPQAIWTGTISFGLVSVPVRLYPATRKQDVRFVELDRVTGQRIRHQRVRPVGPDQERGTSAPVESAGPMRLQEDLADTVRQWQRGREAEPSIGRPVAYDDVVKGFEVAPRQYVGVSRGELEAIAPEPSRSIDIEQFVDDEAVDPIFFQTSYYVAPDHTHSRSFALLLEAMAKTRACAIGWVVLRRKRHLALLRPFQGLMLLTTMLHADEVLPRSGLEVAVPTDLTKKEREMAALLVTTLTGPFEPERYRDEYRQRVKDLIAGKTPVTIAAAEPTPTGVADLMAALRASVEQARKRKGRPLRRAASKAPTRRRRKTA